MNRMLLCVLMACFCLPSWAANNKELYKCLVNGKVRYTDQIPNSSWKCESVFGRKPSAAASADASQEGEGGAENGKPSVDNGASGRQPERTLADKQLEDKNKQLIAENVRNSEELERAQQQTRENNCRGAKNNIQTLQLGRIARVDEKGERYYLDDAMIAQELAKAKKDAEEWCGK